MSIPSNSITPNTTRESLPAYRLSANLRQAIFGALKARLSERVNAPDQRPAASAPPPSPRFREPTP